MPVAFLNPSDIICIYKKAGIFARNAESLLFPVYVEMSKHLEQTGEIAKAVEYSQNIQKIPKWKKKGV
jgi:hypothetical protein